VAEPKAQTEESEIGFERLVLFSDAVFAIVITLLVLPLTAEIEFDSADFVEQLTHLGPKIVSFVLGFLVIGQFWVAHHRLFGSLRRADYGLIWINLIALMTVCFLPFPTAVLGNFPLGDDHLPVVFYAVSMSATSVLLTSTWLYSVQRRLVDPELDGERVRALTTRSFVTTGIMVLSIGAAFISLYLAMTFWLVLIPLARILLVKRQHRVRSQAVG
jgi:uncharacterized membrane protein